MNYAHATLIQVSPENQHAHLSFGLRRIPIMIREVSRVSFVAAVKKSVAMKLRVGKESILSFQGTTYRIGVANKWLNRNGEYEVELDLLEELAEAKLPRKSFFAKSRSVDLCQRDPIVQTSFLTAMIVTIMILPAWGGKWGTADMLCNGATTVWTALTDLFTGRR